MSIEEFVGITVAVTTGNVIAMWIVLQLFGENK